MGISNAPSGPFHKIVAAADNFFGHILIVLGPISTPSQLKTIDMEVREEIIEANNFALNSPLPEPQDVATDVYSQKERKV